MNIVEKMSRTNYEAFVSFIAYQNNVSNGWCIKVDDDKNNNPRSNRTIHDILLTAKEVTITYKFSNNDPFSNDRIVVYRSFDEYGFCYQGDGRNIRTYEELMSKIVDESQTISSSRTPASSAYRDEDIDGCLNSSE